MDDPLKMVLSHSHTVPSSTFHPAQLPYHPQIPPGAPVYNQQFLIRGTPPVSQPGMHRVVVPPPRQVSVRENYPAGAQWESVYNPFGGCAQRNVPAEQKVVVSGEEVKDQEHFQIDGGMVAGENQGSTPKAGKSYRDVVSGKPPLHTTGSGGQRLGDSPTMKQQSILKKGVGEEESSLLATEKNLTKRNVTTNTQAAGTPNEFQKIERRKGRTSAGGTRTLSPPRVVPVAGQTNNNTSNTGAAEGNSRFDILANPKTTTSNRQGSEAEGGSFRGFAATTGGSSLRRIKLNNEDAAQTQNSSQTRKTAYINNDLTGDEVEENLNEEETERARLAAAGLRERLTTKTGKKKRRDDSEKSKRKRKGNASPLCYWFGVIFWTVTGYCQGGARWFVDLIVDIGSQLWDITLHCSRQLYTKVWMGLQGIWYKTGDKLRNILVRFRQRDWRSFKFWRRRKKIDTWGLEENITLPSTGEEAMRRLLSCRGQDAYSILGLRADCSEDEIKRYYKRQAVLVHPDKNVAYGAEEAFKILHHAWVSIGTSEARQKYNLGNIHRTKAMQELEELMEKLKQKMEEALSTMHCDCGNKHRRFVTKRTVSQARYCRRCKDYHSAREKNLLKHMKPNSHLVQYRLITGKSSGHQQQQSTSGHNRPPSDADIDALFGMLESRRRGNIFERRSQDYSQGPAADLFAPSQSASYRPPSFGGADSGRPRKAGRRRKK